MSGIDQTNVASTDDAEHEALPLVDDSPNPPEGTQEAEFAAAAAAPTLTRAQVLERAQTWVDEHVPYSQSSYHSNRFGRYRQDCSGYVSMCWALPTSYTTATISQVSSVIGWGDLQPGDALWRRSGGEGHIALFVGWNDAAHTQPIVDEEYETGHPCTHRAWSARYAHQFTPRRGNNVSGGSPAPGPGGHTFRTWGTGVRIRKEPNTTSPIVAKLAGPTTVEVKCQRHGQQVTISGHTNDGWSFLPQYNGYISNIYIQNPAAWLPGVPEC